MLMKSFRSTIRRLSIPTLRAKFFLPETTAEEKALIREEVQRRVKEERSAKRKGKTPRADISNIYGRKGGGYPVQGGGCS